MGTSVKISVDYRALEAALKRLPVETEKALGNRMKNAMSKLAVDAKDEKYHSYKAKSGRLDSSPQVGKSTSWKHGEVYLDTGLAVYARRIHEGGKGLLDSLGREMTNRPDQFLHRAFDDKKANIIKSIKTGVTQAINRAGL